MPIVFRPPGEMPPDSLERRPLDASASALTAALDEAFGVLEAAVPMAQLTSAARGEAMLPEHDVSVDLIARRFDKLDAVVGRAEAAVQLLARWAVGGGEAPAPAELTAGAEALRRATAAVAGARRARPAGGRQGERAPETAHAMLLGRLFDRVEPMVLDDPLLALERRASRWWFERWSVLRRPSEHAELARRFREQEWSLVERPALALDAPVVTALPDQEFFREVPGRQQRLARALRRSFAGLFAVRERRGDRAVFEALPSGRRYRVHEHNPEIEYGPGSLGLGRLVPLGQRHLRSPGMVFLVAPGPEWEAKLAEAMEKARRGFPPAVAVEALLSNLQSRESLPRVAPPADSAAEAEALLERLREALGRAGLAERTSAEAAPSELRAAATGEAGEFFRYAVDKPVGEWAGALAEQAGKGVPRAGSGKAGAAHSPTGSIISSNACSTFASSWRYPRSPTPCMASPVRIG